MLVGCIVMEETNRSSVLIALGKNIKHIRLLRGLSQENLASGLQKSINFVSLVENGKTGLSIQTLVDICRVLNIDANTLFSGIVAPTDVKPNSFITDSLNLFDEKDKAIVTDLITYINNSKA